MTIICYCNRGLAKGVTDFFKKYKVNPPTQVTRTTTD